MITTPGGFKTIQQSTVNVDPANGRQDMDASESSPLFERDQGHKEGLIESKSKVEITIYKRRWYVLFVFTAETLIYNMAWNTWAPIQEPCKIAFDWTDFDLLLLTSWAPISLVLTSAAFAWLMDTKG